MNFLKKLNKYLSVALLPIKRNATFFVFMYALGLLCCYGVVPDRPWCHVYGDTWTELFFDVYVLSAILSVIPRVARRWVRLLFYILAYTTAIADMYCYMKFGATLNPTMLLLVGETNAGEASEFLESYLGMDVLFSRVGLVLLFAAMNIVWGVWHDRIMASVRKFAGKSVKLHGIAEAVKKTLGRWSCGLHVFASTLVVVLFVVCACMSWENKVLLVRLMSYDNIGSVEHELTKHPHGEQYLPLYRLVFSVYANELTAKQLVKLKANIDKIQVDSCSYRSKTIVLIIGESYNRNHSQLYGYDIKNTPRQQKLQRRGELVPFSDVVSPWNLTSFVFKHLFSLYTVGDKGEWCDYPLFPEVFRKAGYHVTFVTNQFLPEAKEAVYDFSGGFFLNDETLSKAQFDTRNTRLFRFDNGLLCDYEKLKDQGEGKPQLIIFHLKGQHVDYRTRCPKVQKKFNKDTYKELRPDLNDKERTVLSDYDNAVLYNDSIVNAIVDKFRKKDAIVVYVPDHGEEVYDGAHFYGRMHSTEITPRLAHAEFEIPMWIWTSNEYRRKHPDIWQEVKTARKKAYMTDATSYLLMYLAGIQTPLYRERLNVLSSKYDEKRPRILKKQVDYDVLMAKEKKEKQKTEKKEVKIIKNKKK